MTLIERTSSDADSMSEPHRHVLGMRIDAGTYESALTRILGWAAEEPTPAQYVCCANVHMTMESYDSPEFRDVVNGASLVTSDGMPLVWMLHRLGISEARPVNGPTLMLEVCRAAAELGLRVGFYGASQQTLDVLTDKLLERFPLLEIGYAFSPPYRSLSAYEDEKIVDDILAANLRILFVGLGCPRQELWMAEHRGRLPLVQLGVGAAFDFHAGKVKRAPAWMQKHGLEWLFRLRSEPRRLWRRYLYNNPRFLYLAALQLSGLKRY